MEDFYNLRSKQYYSTQRAKKYGKDAPQGEKYQVYNDTLSKKCSESDSNYVLELGCGTGRYFFYLSGVAKLIGVDISENMLKAAKENLVRIPALLPVTEFVHSRIEDFDTNEKFDLVYSIGTIGEFCELNVRMLEKIISFLKPGGLLFFTVVDSESYVKRPIGIKKRIFRAAVKLLPLKLRVKVDGAGLFDYDFKDLFLSKVQLENILSSIKTPVTWETSKARDNWHVHHIIKITR